MKSSEQLRSFRHQLRAENRATKYESLVRQMLNDRMIEYKFQIITGFYIVDFVIVGKNLILEIDGKYHQTDYQQQYDFRRDKFLTQAGFRVARLKNEEIDRLDYLLDTYSDIPDYMK